MPDVDPVLTWWATGTWIAARAPRHGISASLTERAGGVSQNETQAGLLRDAQYRG